MKTSFLKHLATATICVSLIFFTIGLCKLMVGLGRLDCEITHLSKRLNQATETREGG